MPTLVVFTSEDAHYSIEKLASFMGIGSENVRLIKTNEIGKMKMDHLGKSIENTSKKNNTFCFIS
jgi:glutamate/tyrosine decarboxylase-like PLP-dependent enzyme